MHLRWTYIILYGLAWVHEFQWLHETYDDLAAIFTALEGKEINSRGIRQRLTDLVGYGLVERRQVGGRYRTYLLVRHEHKGDAPNVTSRSSSDALQRHPIKNNYVVVDIERLEQPPQHLVDKGDARTAVCAGLLEAMGVFPKVADRLAQEEHVTEEYLERIMGYRGTEAAKGNILGPGWVVTAVGQAWEPPEASAEADRYRYIQGKYKEWVRH